jgi:MATE family multidrug resistance protein
MSAIASVPIVAPWRREIAETLRLAMPLAAAQVAIVAINTTNVLLLGRLGAEPLAAAGLAWSAHFFVFFLAFGTVTAVAPLSAIARGRGRHVVREVRRYVRQGLWVATGSGLILAALLWQVRPILLLIGQEPKLAAMAEEFMRPFVFGLVPSLGFVVLRSFLAAFGQTRAILSISVGAVAVNAVLNYGLIFGRFGLPAWGLRGAGVGSALVASGMFLALLAHVLASRRFRRFAVLGHWWRPDWPKLKEILRVGTPIGGILFLEIGLFSTAAQLMGRIGTAELAAHQIAIQCAAIAFMVPTGIGHAATVRVGIAFGQGDRAGTRRAGQVAFATGVATAVATALLFWFLPSEIVALFLEPGSTGVRAVAEIAVAFLAVAALFQLADATQVIAAGALRGLRDTRTPMLIAAIGYWGVGFPLCVALAFPLGLGGLGVWVGLAISLAMTALPLVVRFELRTRPA